ncbi:MAG: alpha/beta fold hydrolase [Nitriliruptoraceae bacterium]
MLSGLGRLLLVVGGAWLALVLLAAVFQRQLIYLPERSRPVPPADVEEVALTTEDGLELTAWYLAAEVEPVTTILLAPGNAGNRAARVPMARALNERGHAVLLLDYRGYGQNPGRPSEEGLLADARAAHDHLVARPDVEAARIAYLGESIGSAVVAALAAERPPVALVLRSPFPQLAEVGRAVYPFLPVGTLLRDRYPTSEHLDAYDGPVLVVAGAADRIVPTELSREVARRADATLVEVADAGHNDAALFVGERLLTAVDTHLRAAVDAAS